MFLHDIKSPRGSRKRRKIVGRGSGSGHGKTSCRGQKGQMSRSGRAVILGSEGGQMPLIRRLPKVGFRRKNPLVYQIVKLESLKKYKEGTVVTPEFLKTKGLIKSLFKPFKILGDGEISKPLTVQAFAFSKSAQEKITKAGGRVETIDMNTIKALVEEKNKSKT